MDRDSLPSRTSAALVQPFIQQFLHVFAILQDQCRQTYKLHCSASPTFWIFLVLTTPPHQASKLTNLHALLPPRSTKQLPNCPQALGPSPCPCRGASDKQQTRQGCQAGRAEWRGGGRGGQKLHRDEACQRLVEAPAMSSCIRVLGFVLLFACSTCHYCNERKTSETANKKRQRPRPQRSFAERHVLQPHRPRLC